MLIDFNTIVKKYGKPIGIIHVGAHLMEERETYISNSIFDIIWIEANPKIYQSINSKKLLKQEKIFNHAISDKDNKLYEFNITNNSQSSSILKLDKHKIHHPQVYVNEIIPVYSKRMDTLFLENNIDINNYNFLNIDIQGAELLAIKSFGDLLNSIKYIYTEINTNTLYKDCALVSEIDDYLSKYGFKRVETSMTVFEWGDALYIKEWIS
jgi:FkbM family methyltransferase